MNEFEQRLAKHYDELKWLYYELYGSDKQAFDYFCSMLNKSWLSRNELLRELDDARISDPEWYAGNDSIGMMMYTE